MSQLNILQANNARMLDMPQSQRDSTIATPRKSIADNLFNSTMTNEKQKTTGRNFNVEQASPRN